MSTLLLGVLLLAATLLTYKAILERRNADALFVHGVKAQGIVIGHTICSPGRSANRGPEYPLIQFTTTDGKQVVVAKRSQFPVLNKLEKIVLFYEESNPQNIVFDSEPGSPLPYLLPGLMWVIAGVAMLVHFYH